MGRENISFMYARGHNIRKNGRMAIERKKKKFTKESKNIFFLNLLFQQCRRKRGDFLV
jgi:hypothetical protein